MTKILRSTDKNYVELEIYQLHESNKAVLISDGTLEVWIPKSQLEDDPELLENGLTRLVIPEWLATEKGLV